jgi:phage portal protein BeeE
LKIFGLTLFEQKAVRANGTLLPVNSRAGWFGSVLESFTGAWQRNVEVKLDTVLTYSTVFRCISLISSDVSKMRMKLVELTDGIWNETSSPSFTPVLTKPNRYQNRIQFFASWIISKLVWGNAYILLERDARKVVVRMYVLDPTMVTPLVAPDGAVYYQLKRDDLAGIPADAVAVPASEIIHDRWNTLFHPLVGLSPIYACGISAIQGLKIKNNSAVFFGNGSQPGGVLTAPGAIGDEGGRCATHRAAEVDRRGCLLLFWRPGVYGWCRRCAAKQQRSRSFAAVLFAVPSGPHRVHRALSR